MGPEKTPIRLVVNREAPRKEIRGLYLVTDQGEGLSERVEAAVAGGAACVQYRDKGGDFQRRLSLGRDLQKVCRERGALFIVNDDLKLAAELQADGLHLGQDDGSVAEARRVLGKEKIIGVSTHSAAEARRAEADGADYIGFGAMYPTVSKSIEHMPGPKGLAAVRQEVGIPIVAIGGINRDNACRVIDAGADAVAVISAVLASPEPAIAATEISLLFNRKAPLPQGAVLTVAGSDSGGGAGIQADIKTVSLLGSYAASALTAVTAQNSRGVSAIYGMPATFVGEQLEAVLSDLPVDVVKAGMLLSDDIIEVVAEKLVEHGKRIVVVDPVMAAKGGTPLLDREALQVFRERLIPLTYLLTPNIPEAEKLTGLEVHDERGMEETARALVDMGARNVLVKGGHLPAGDAVDVLYDGRAFSRFASPRILTRNTHGTGCTYASAIAAFLARGEPLPQAVAKAKEFVSSAIRHAHPMGKGHGPVNHFLAARESRDL